MLDQDIIEQLKSAFSKLEKEVELRVELCQHRDQSELLDMLEGVAQANSEIKVTKVLPIPGSETLTPKFSLYSNGNPTGVVFSGIPGGHEFTSLIVAILNADGKGKMPDDMLTARVKRLKGPIELKTFISLSCENCPDVVQALNQMAFLHPQFQHEMIDGAYVPEEIKALSLQGVPSVVSKGKLLHSGRIGFLELLNKLEKEFGVSEEPFQRIHQDLGLFDVVVVGGGPAGVSSAIYSARKGLKTLLLAEKVGGQVLETRGIENLISVPMTEGPILGSNLKEHLSRYPVKVLEHRRVQSIAKKAGVTLLSLESGEKLSAKSLIVATGAKWRELGVPGEREYIGRGVAFCPHCDGPFYQGKKVAVIGGGNSGVEAAIDLAGIVAEVVLIEFAESLKADHVLVEKLKSLSNVSILTHTRTQEIRGNGEKVIGLICEDRSSGKPVQVELDGVFVQIGLVPNSQFLKGVVELTKYGEVVIDNKCRTSVPGIYAAGDVSTVPYKQIVIAMGEGAKAALSAFEDQMLHA